MLTLKMICVVIGLFSGSLLQSESDWPTFRGPRGDGVSASSVAESWNADAQSGELEGVLWQVDVLTGGDAGLTLSYASQASVKL